MPITKIFYVPSSNIDTKKFALLGNEIEKLLLAGFQAGANITGEVIFIPSTVIHHGKELYIEVDCRQEKYYVTENIDNLASTLEKLVGQQLNITNSYKLRILSYDNDHVYGCN